MAHSSQSDAPVECDVPAWLSQDLFLDILKENVKDFKKINKFVVGAGTNAGDNYSSQLLKVDIEVELTDSSSRSKSFMLKLAPTSEQSKAILEISNTFKKELIMYDKVLPQLERLYSEAGLSDITFAPKSFHFSKDIDCETVLMENMRLNGFKNANRLIGLDVEHTECVLRKLAQLHAASACWCAAEGRVPKVLQNNMYREDTRFMMEPMNNLFINLLLDYIKDYKGSDQYAHKIAQYKTTFFDVMIKASKANDKGFNVINHGDCWTNNILFQYNADGSIKRTCFVDFQVTKYGSPVQDLYYFLISSPSLDIKVEKFDHFIEFYYEQLKQNLELLKYSKNMPTLEDIQRDLQLYGAWGFTTVISAMSAVLLDPTEDANMSNVFGEDDAAMAWKRSLYSNARFRSHAEILFPWLNKRGLLNLEE